VGQIPDGEHTICLLTSRVAFPIGLRLVLRTTVGYCALRIRRLVLIAPMGVRLPTDVATVSLRIMTIRLRSTFVRAPVPSAF
jgi:hypothetical protein